MKPTTRRQRLTTYDLTLIALFTAITSVCAWICIPAAVPFTMQAFGVLLSVGVLGGRRGTLCVLAYLLLGLCGAPVFSGFSGGVGRLMSSTGGYIAGFLACALVMWALERLRAPLMLSMALGMAACYALGTLWFMAVSGGETGLMGALSWCVLPYLLPDALKIALALTLCRRLRRAGCA